MLSQRVRLCLRSQIKKLIGVPVGAVPEKKKAQKKVNYPQNLLTALKADIKNSSEDQILGLAFAKTKQTCVDFRRL